MHTTSRTRQLWLATLALAGINLLMLGGSAAVAYGARRPAATLMALVPRLIAPPHDHLGPLALLALVLVAAAFAATCAAALLVGATLATIRTIAQAWRRCGATATRPA